MLSITNWARQNSLRKDKAEETAFTEVIKRLTNAPLLSHSSLTKPSVLTTDASKYAVDASL